MSESEPIEDVSKITFIMSKSKGRATLRDFSVADTLLTGYTAYGIKRARPISRLNNGTGEPIQKW